jgi:hypothetical protein
MIALRKYWQLVLIVSLASVVMVAWHARDEALRAEGAAKIQLAQLRAKMAHDSTLERAADTVVRRDTVRLTRYVTRYDTLRRGLNIHDTTDVVRFVATADSTIHACREAVGSLTALCQKKDTLIADLRAQLAVRVPPKASKAQRVLWGLGGLAVGVIADRAVRH